MGEVRTESGIVTLSVLFFCSEFLFVFVFVFLFHSISKKYNHQFFFFVTFISVFYYMILFF